MTGPVRVRITVEASPSVDEVEIDRAEWAAMTPEQRNQLLEEMTMEAVNNAGGAGWHLLNPDDEADI